MSSKSQIVCAIVLLLAAAHVASQDNSTTPLLLENDLTICSLCFCDSKEVLCAQRNLTASVLNETAWDDVSDNVTVIRYKQSN